MYASFSKNHCSWGKKIRNLCAFCSVYLQLEWDSALAGIWIWFSCFAFEKMGLRLQLYMAALAPSPGSVTYGRGGALEARWVKVPCWPLNGVNEAHKVALRNILEGSMSKALHLIIWNDIVESSTI